MASTTAESGSRTPAGGGLARLYLLALYDNLGHAALVNLLWLAGTVPWLAAGWLGTAAGGAVADATGRAEIRLVGLAAGAVVAVVSPPTLFVVAACAPWVRGEATDLRAAWRLTRQQLLRLQATACLLGAAVGLLLANALFYHALLGGWTGWVLSSLMGWLVVGVGCLCVYLLPLWVAGPELGLRRLLRDCALLALDNPLFTIGLTAAAGLASVAVVVSGIGLALGGVTAVALLLNLGLARVQVRYGGRPPAADRRGWREVVQPWR